MSLFLSVIFKLQHARINLKTASVLLFLTAFISGVLDVISWCDLNRREFKTGDTALHIAIKRNYTDVVDLLLAAGSRHDIYNHQGETAAFDAVATNKIEVIRLMIVHNCDLEQPGKYFSNGIYKSLFQIAAEKGHFEICRLLATFGYVDFTARVHIYTNYIPSRLVTEQEDVVQWLRKMSSFYSVWSIFFLSF
jgi:hypothetical protein